MTRYITRLHQGANIRFGLATAVVVLFGIFVAWPNLQELVKTRANINEINVQIDDAEIELEAERNQYRLLKAEYSIRAETDQKTISTILPEEAGVTDIVRELEKKVNEIIGLTLDAVTFGKTTPVKEADYFILPIKIKLSGTEEKLMTFLRHLEKTGNIIANDNQATRLLDVQDVTMKFKDRDTKTEMEEEISINFSVNAYNLPSSKKITD